MKKVDIFLIFAQNIDWGYTTHNLCFEAKIRKKYMKIEGEARDVTQTRPCIMQKFLKVVKMIFFR